MAVENPPATGAWTALGEVNAKLEARVSLQTPGVRAEMGGAAGRLRGGYKALEEVAAAAQLFVLPAGLRPPTLVEMIVILSSGTATVLKITAAGVVSLKDPLPATRELFLDALTFNLT